MQMKTKRGWRRGLSLIETIAAIILIMFAVAVFGATFPTAANAVAKNRNRDTAANACNAELDAWRREGYDKISSTTLKSGSTLLRTASPSSLLGNPASLPAGTVAVTISRLNDTYAVPATAVDTGRVQVTVTATWKGVGADKGSWTLTTIIRQAE